MKPIRQIDHGVAQYTQIATICMDNCVKRPPSSQASSHIIEQMEIVGKF